MLRKKIILLMLTISISVIIIGNLSLAVVPNKTVEYKGKNTGKVIFDGKIHADKGLRCNDCHPKIFPMKKGVKITMADKGAGRLCFKCHNGTRAFNATTSANCIKCHSRKK